MSTVLNGREIQYVLKFSRRAKRLRLAVYRDGRFVVSVPQGTRVATVENFIQRKSHWVIAKIDHFKLLGGTVLPKSSRADYLARKNEALNFVLAKVAHFNASYNFTFKKITIRNQRSRWGSCSRTGTLSFNYRIILLPERLADYIVVHELCHLEQLNHSHKFWELVAKSFPDHKEIRKELRSTASLS